MVVSEMKQNINCVYIPLLPGERGDLAGAAGLVRGAIHGGAGLMAHQVRINSTKIASEFRIFIRPGNNTMVVRSKRIFF